jgi:hypothetical protein
MQGIHTRKELTDEWKNRGIVKNEYETLTATIAFEIFEKTPTQHLIHKGLNKNEKLRDHMTVLELKFCKIGEEETIKILRSKGTQGFSGCLQAAREGGKIAGDERKKRETSGTKVLSAQNSSSLKNVELSDNLEKAESKLLEEKLKKNQKNQNSKKDKNSRKENSNKKKTTKDFEEEELRVAEKGSELNEHYRATKDEGRITSLTENTKSPDHLKTGHGFSKLLQKENPNSSPQGVNIDNKDAGNGVRKLGTQEIPKENPKSTEQLVFDCHVYGGRNYYKSDELEMDFDCLNAE